MPDKPGPCERCGIERPVVANVHFGTLCPNCLYLRGHCPEEFDKKPEYGPTKPEPVNPLPMPYVRDRRPGWPNPVNPYAY